MTKEWDHSVTIHWKGYSSFTVISIISFLHVTVSYSLSSFSSSWVKVMGFINGAQQRIQRLLFMHQHKAGFIAILQNQVPTIEIHPSKHVSFKFRNMCKSRSSNFWKALLKLSCVNLVKCKFMLFLSNFKKRGVTITAAPFLIL